MNDLKIVTTGVLKVIENDLYVDNLITGEDIVEKAFKLYKAVKSVMSFGGFNLRKWHTNLLELHDLINQSQKEPESNFRPIKYWELYGMEALMYSPLRIK